ncbi:MAG: DUF3800 domain-containing protein [Chloroflexi bacterium]|nr:DUF3800 domain-containing protein [Chloroflexota bacterium]
MAGFVSGYFDESGDVAPFSGSRHFILAGYVTANPRPVELHVQRARKRLRKQPGLSELKWSTSEFPISERLLSGLAGENLEVYAVVINKRAILRPPQENEELYRRAVLSLLLQVSERRSRLSFFLDKRYTTPGLFDRLEGNLRESLMGLSDRAVVIRQLDSQQNKAIQAADFVAGAFYLKYEKGDERLWRILEPRIVVEEMLTIPKW